MCADDTSVTISSRGFDISRSKCLIADKLALKKYIIKLRTRVLLDCN